MPQRWEFIRNVAPPYALLSLDVTVAAIRIAKHSYTLKLFFPLSSVSRRGLMDHLWMSSCQASFNVKGGARWAEIVGHSSPQDSTGPRDSAGECLAVVIDHETQQWGGNQLDRGGTSFIWSLFGSPHKRTPSYMGVSCSALRSSASYVVKSIHIPYVIFMYWWYLSLYQM